MDGKPQKYRWGRIVYQFEEIYRPIVEFILKTFTDESLPWTGTKVVCQRAYCSKGTKIKPTIFKIRCECHYIDRTSCPNVATPINGVRKGGANCIYVEFVDHNIQIYCPSIHLLKCRTIIQMSDPEIDVLTEIIKFRDSINETLRTLPNIEYVRKRKHVDASNKPAVRSNG